MASKRILSPFGAPSLVGSSTGFIGDEVNPKLRGRPGAETFREMADNDPLIGGILYALTQLLKAAEWRVLPKDKSGAAQDAADWMQAVLFDEMEHPFGDVIDHAALMFIYGYSPVEPVYRRRAEDGSVGLRGISPRPPESVWNWRFDPESGEWTGMVQFRRDAVSDPVEIPRERLINFRTTAARTNPEGRSLLRNAWRSYERKKALEVAEGRLGMRAAGIVVLDVPAVYLDPNAPEDKKLVRVALQNQLTNLAQDRQAGIMLPSDPHPGGSARAFDVRFVTADGTRTVDIDRMIQRYDQRIAVSVLAQFVLLGTKSGSFALSSDQTELFAVAVGGHKAGIQEELQRYLVRRLWAINGFDPAVMPKLMASDIEDVDIAKLGAYLQSLTSAGAPLFPNDALLKHLLAAAKLPEPEPEELEEAKEAASAAAAAGGPPGSEPDDADPTAETDDDADA